MGDRVSISFVNGGEESVALFSHWDGMDFVKQAKKYARELRQRWIDHKKPSVMPLDRMEPHTVMVDFIRWLFHTGYFNTEEFIESNYYFGKDSNDGDNSDNGHHQIQLKFEED